MTALGNADRPPATSERPAKLREGAVAPHHDEEKSRIMTSASSLIKYKTGIYKFSVATIIILSIVLSLNSILSMGFNFERNYNEGWNVYNAQRLINHEVIYDGNYWRVNNYPILSFLAISSLNGLVHNLLLSGRILSLLSFAAIGGLAALATRRLGGDRIESAFGGGCALGFCYLVAPRWIAVDDPQTFGEALMLAALVSYVSGPMRYRNILGAALLAMLAGFTKHNLVAIPLAISLDLALRAPRRLPFWLFACGCIGLVLAALTQIIAGGAFFDHLLSPRTFDWYHVYYHFMKFILLFKIPILLILLFSWRIFRGRSVLAIYGVVAVTAGAVLAGMEGTSFNMLQDAAAFLAIAAGVMLHEVRTLASARRVSRGAIALTALGLAPLLIAQPIFTKGLAALGDVDHAGRILQANRAMDQSFQADAAYISGRQGLAICESLLLCYNAGQPFTLDPFNARQYILAGRLNEGDLISRIAAGDFSVIQLRENMCDDPASTSCGILHYPRKIYRFTDNVLYSINKYYRIDRTSPNGAFYVPK